MDVFDVLAFLRYAAYAGIIFVTIRIGLLMYDWWQD